MEHTMRSRVVLNGLAFALPVVAMALSADTSIVAAQSTLIATFRQENVPVDAPFKSFTGTIVYDITQPMSARAALDVDMTSLDIGDETYNAEVRKPAWFDSAHFPQATFRSTAIQPGIMGQTASAGKFTVIGTLTLKGRSLTVTVPIRVARAGKTNSYDGNFELSRKAFGIGDPTWKDVLDDKVRVRFHLTTAAP